MKEDCRNDCLEPLRFPIRPDNRAGLKHIKYRIGNYAEIREALLRNLNKTAFLSGWTHRGADDPGIALLEGAAILGSILTFYQELYANEAYLRTAQWRESVADLVRLLGYHLSPGLGGNATFAFLVKGTKPVTVPAKFPLKAQLTGQEKPADFETKQEAIAYPWLSKFNLYRPLQTPQISPAINEFYISAPDQEITPVALKAGDRLLIGENDSSTTPPTLKNVEIVIVDSIRTLHGTKLFKIKGKLKRTASDPEISEIVAYKIGRTFHHFGHTGPRTLTKPPAQITATSQVSTDGKTTTTTSTPPPEYNISFYRHLAYVDYSFTFPYTDFTGTPSTIKIIEPSLDEHDFPLDAEVKDLPNGATCILQLMLYHSGTSLADLASKEFTLVNTIKDVKSASVTWGLATGSTSMVTLTDTFYVKTSVSYGYWQGDIRLMQLHEVLSPALTLHAGLQEVNTPSDKYLYFYGTEAQALNLKGRKVALSRSNAEPVTIEVTDVQSQSSALAARTRLRRLTLGQNAQYSDFPNENAVVTVYGNLVDATQGKTEQQAALGNGDSRQVFQTFKLPKSPLTYLRSVGETPPEVPELQVYVNDRLWRRVPSFFGQKSNAEIYIVREDGNNESWVQFGDGKTGARLPSGINNVEALYRTGTGAFGPLKEGDKVQAIGKLDNLDKVEMPSVAEDGSQPEDENNARDAAPGKIQSLGRLVSLKDFESETLAISGVASASASWRLEDNIPAIVITVLMQTGRDDGIANVRQVIADYDRCRGPRRFPVIVKQGKLLYTRIQASYSYNPTFRQELIEAAIRKALGTSSGKPGSADDQSGLFSLRKRSFGQTEYLTRIVGTIQNVEGVVSAKVTGFNALGVASDPATLSTAAVLPLSPSVAPGANQVLSLYTGHLTLQGSTEPAGEEC